MKDIIKPNWCAPKHIKAFTTTRAGGVSQPPYHSFNLANHVADDPMAVTKNRKRLMGHYQLPSEPIWLEQIHSNTVTMVNHVHSPLEPCDGTITTDHNTVLAILTADCLPLLLTDIHGHQIAAIHVGWRGLLQGIVERALSLFSASNEQMLAWCGPSICQANYPIDAGFYDNAITIYPDFAKAFKKIDRLFYFDLPKATTIILHGHGVKKVHLHDGCTFQSTKHYSYRKDGVTGRQATIIYKSSMHS